MSGYDKWEISGCRRGLDVVSNLIYLGLLFIWLCIFYFKDLCFSTLLLGGKTVIVELVLLGLKFGSQSRVLPQRKKASWGKDMRLAKPPFLPLLQLSFTHPHTQIQRQPTVPPYRHWHTHKNTWKLLHTVHIQYQTSTRTHRGYLLKAGGGAGHPLGTGVNWLADTVCPCLTESAQGPLGVSGDLLEKLLASSPLWHHRGNGDREQEGVGGTTE